MRMRTLDRHILGCRFKILTPKNKFKMKEQFEDVEKILSIYVAQLAEERFCPHCLGNLKKSSIISNVLKCSRRGFRKELLIVKKGPWYNCNISWLKLAQILFLYLNNTTNKVTSLITGIGLRTIGKKLKSIGGLLTGNVRIGGPGIIVEIDESKFGKRKYNRGHKIEGVWVLGMVERTPEKKTVFVQVKDIKAKTLETIIKKYVKEGSIIHTDCWKGYSGLCKLNYIHHTVNHSVSFVDKETGIHTNTIEGNWSGINVNIPFRYRNKFDINRFLELFAFKRDNKIDAFKKLLKITIN